MWRVISGAIITTVGSTGHVTDNQSETKRHDQHHRDQFCSARKHGATLPNFHPASKPNVLIEGHAPRLWLMELASGIEAAALPNHFIAPNAH
jgi:hypothetical protein